MISKVCSNFIELLRKKFGKEKPFALTHDGWREFYQEYRKEMPIRHFLLERAPDKIADVYGFLIGDRIPNVRTIIAHRITERTHVIRTGLDVGYHEIDDRMFYGMFNLLTEFVESEMAWMEFICMDENHPLYDDYKRERFISNYLDPFGIYGSLFKSTELGVMHITNCLEMNPYDSNSVAEQNSIIKQQEKYKEILELYVWFTTLRPNRTSNNSFDAYMSIKDREKFEEEYGVTFILSDKFKKDHPDVYNEYMNKLNNKHDLEHNFYEEDTKMLKKLIDIRSTLWT